MKVNGVEITQETIVKTRQVFADMNQACIDDVKNKKEQVSDELAFIRWEEAAMRDMLEGRCDGSVTFMQRAYYLQTDQDLAILPQY